MENDIKEMLSCSFEEYLRLTTDIFFVKDRSLKYRVVSASFNEFANGATACGRTDLELFGPVSARSFAESDENVMKMGAPISLTQVIKTKEGGKKYYFTTKYPLRNCAGEIAGIYGLSRDVTEKEETNDRDALIKCAMCDPLTGLLNRKGVFESAAEYLNGAGLHKKHALLFIDLDNFKSINDLNGHPFGDKILKETAERLKNLFRDDDIVGRTGGDEFMALLKNISSAQDISSRAQSVLNALTFSVGEGETRVEVSCSVGASVYDKAKSFDALYEEADKAMYRAKRAGRKTAEIFE